MSAARPMPGRESGTGRDVKLQKGAISVDVHLEQRGAPASLTRELGGSSCPRRDRATIGQRSLRMQTAPREHIVCVDSMLQACPIAAETHRALVSAAAPCRRRRGAQWQVWVRSGVTPWTWSHPIGVSLRGREKTDRRGSRRLHGPDSEVPRLHRFEFLFLRLRHCP